MFFIYKKRPLKLSNPHTTPHQRRGTLVLTTDLEVLTTSILPMYFLLKQQRSFLFLYRLKTVRSMVGFKRLFYYIFKKPKPMVVVLPSKHNHYMYRALSLLKAPFLFPTETTTTVSRQDDHLILLKSVYSAARLAHQIRYFGRDSTVRSQ